MSKPSLNLCMISGTVTDIPYIAKDMCKFKLTSIHKIKTSDREDRAVVDVVTFGDLASMCSNLTEGSRVYAEGKLKYCSKDLPNGRKYYYTELHAKDVQKI